MTRLRRGGAWLAALAAAALLAAAPAHADTVLRITLQLPITSPLGKNLSRFKELVEAADAGLAIEIYPAAQLYTDKEVPTAVASGQIEMGVASLARFAGTVPAVDVFFVPFLIDDTGLVEAATAPGSPVRAPIDAALTDIGARPLWWQPYGLTVLLTRGIPVRTPADMQGLKIRTFGKAMESFVNAVGGAATNISGSRQYLAYERGTVDGGFTGLVNVPERKLHQVLDTVTMTHNADIEFLVVINERVWQGLDDAQRTVLTEAGRTAERELRTEFAGLEADALAFVKDNGMTVIDLTPEEREAWREATAGLRDDFITRAGPLGAELVEAAEGLKAAR